MWQKQTRCFFSRKVSYGLGLDTFLEKTLTLSQEKVRGMLKAEFMKWLFRFGIIKLRVQLRY